MKVAIVGAGAAGLMAAATLAEQSEAEVFLFEKNAVTGRKVSISGGGRCNVTTGIQDVRELLKRYPRGNKFLNSAMYHFGPEQVYDWFEAHGVPLKIEEDLRVFPQSNVGTDIVDTLTRLFQKHDVQLRLRESVKQVEKVADQFKLTTQTGEELIVDRLILTTGGQAYRHTGSTGDGYNFAEALGHSITNLAASLNAFITKANWVKELAGVSFEWVELGVQGKKEYHSAGPIVITHQGISGPAVFALSSQVAFEQYDSTTPLPVTVNFLPNLSITNLQTTLDQLIERDPKQQLRTTIHRWLPKSVVNAMMLELNFPLETTNATVSKPMRAAVVKLLTQCVIPMTGRAGGEEFVTAGGVELSEINPQTMESKLCPGLFFAGEILNIDGYTGGFNLQAAWATGRLAGEHAAI